MQSDVAFWAYHGTAIFGGKPRMKELRAVAHLYPESLHLVARKGSGINDDLNGVETKAAFKIMDDGYCDVECLFSLAKWKRMMLADYGIRLGYGLYTDMNGQPVLLKKRLIVSGDQLIGASSGFDQQTGQPQVSVTLDGVGAKRMLDFTRDNVGNRMAIIFKELKVRSRTITNADGTFAEEEYPAVQVLYDPEIERTSMWFDGGMGILHDSHGYTETHLIRVVAVDAAGNETESEPVRVYVIHKPKEEETEQAALPRADIGARVAMIWPRRRQEQTLPPGTSEGSLYLHAVPPVGLVVRKALNTMTRARRERN